MGACGTVPRDVEDLKMALSDGPRAKLVVGAGGSIGVSMKEKRGLYSCGAPTCEFLAADLLGTGGVGGVFGRSCLPLLVGRFCSGPPRPRGD